MSFLTDIFGNSKKQLGKVATRLIPRLKEVRERWTEYCLALLNEMGVSPAKTILSEDGLASVAAFQYFMFTQLSHEKKYIKIAKREEFFDLIANMIIHENNIVRDTFIFKLKCFHETTEASKLIFSLSECVAKELVGKKAVLGESVALSSNVNFLIVMTKMITAESFRDFKTAKEFENILDTMFNSDT
ncbi:MAG: hypothetical protein JRJ11_16190 [Deltaproteobacteria bacterium]|nr:hypothetical protein [Deltaproteobacteria bacterium]MBW2035368.1 hypothetical protein [Deltaproteobacteria bacterium]MBW2116125.1 hypothetical protein [Deltaproteobacteria bacterium]